MFDEQYKRLNKAQKKAVDTIEGPVMVIAGPGTGKTTILTLRIANILKRTDTAPENILALTFTESGARTMRRKLVETIGTAGYKVAIHTFHGFCNDVIAQYPERFPRIIGSTAIADIDRVAIMEKIIEDSKLEFLRPYGDRFYYVRPALDAIRSMKRETISPDDFEKIIAQQQKAFDDEPDKVHAKGAHAGKMKGDFIKVQERIKKNTELLQLYRAYEAALTEQSFYDFEDMIVEAVKAMRTDEDLLLILQEMYQYILADEHQDANNAQNAVLELLSNFHDQPNLFIVGDEKQAIFRFQGASLQNFLHFKTLYPDAVLIDLEDNYRSTQAILDASHSLITRNALPEGITRAKLRAGAAKGSQLIQVREFASADSERAFVAEDIRARIAAGADPEEIAVLYHDNKDAFPVAEALAKEGIPFRIESDDDLLKDEHIRKLLIIFEAVNDLSDDAALSKLLFVDFLGLDILSVYELIESARRDRRPLRRALQEAFPEFSTKLAAWATAGHNKPFLVFFEKVIHESGFLEQALTGEATLNRMATLGAFWEEIRTISGARKEYFLADFVRHLKRLREHGILTKAGAGISKKGVRLLTAHRSKGLEFDTVYIVGACDGHWSNRTRRVSFHIPGISDEASDAVADERRLFYVALTRARTAVYITFAALGSDGRDQLPCQFISEIDAELKQEDKVEGKVRPPVFRAAPSALADGLLPDARGKEYLKKLFLERGLSVTDLNNYLECPWKYFFVNLVRIPESKSKHQLYGSAVHQSLETHFGKYRDGEDMDSAELLKLFEHNLGRMSLAPEDFADTLAKGHSAISGWHSTYAGLWPRGLIAEYKVRGVHFPVALGQGADAVTAIALNGKLDKVEFLNDRDVNVVDYKTGKPKSKKMLEKPGIDGNYKRQLVFYRLLLDLDDKKRYRMVSGELDFIEPTDSGAYKKERFEITDEDIAEVSSTIARVASEIHGLSFWNSSCAEKSCAYCALSKSLR
ncbi:MAG: UvrD/REP helicase, helicase / ATP-dependent helicase PcrA [Candidatus Parcubacteria bacterium]|nr:UvrD/REP helicase, helicase / ATP-dependent helicase PcrA [Candidatus Parcubacteria bacterium]